jgi:hypothetical protein
MFEEASLEGWFIDAEYAVIGAGYQQAQGVRRKAKE